MTPTVPQRSWQPLRVETSTDSLRRLHTRTLLAVLTLSIACCRRASKEKLAKSTQNGAATHGASGRLSKGPVPLFVPLTARSRSWPSTPFGSQISARHCGFVVCGPVALSTFPVPRTTGLRAGLLLCTAAFRQLPTSVPRRLDPPTVHRLNKLLLLLSPAGIVALPCPAELQPAVVDKYSSRSLGVYDQARQTTKRGAARQSPDANKQTLGKWTPSTQADRTRTRRCEQGTSPSPSTCPARTTRQRTRPRMSTSPTTRPSHRAHSRAARTRRGARRPTRARTHPVTPSPAAAAVARARRALAE